MGQFMSGTRVVMDEHALDRIGSEAAVLGSHALVVTDKGVAGTGLVDMLTSPLEEAGVRVTVFDSVHSNPNSDDAEAGAEAAKDGGCDIVISLGGGSPIDTAKAIAVLAPNGGVVLDWVTSDVTTSIADTETKFPKALLPHIAVPTTIGTGSEVTKGSVITDVRTGQKRVLLSTKLYPTVAILDPRAVEGLPSSIAIATALDALTHAVEGYTSLGANPMSDALTLESIRMIGKYLRPAAAGDPAARFQMLISSCIAGIGFHNSGLGLAHALGNTAQNHWPIHHGAIMGVMLPHVVRFNCIANPPKFAEITYALNNGTRQSGDPWSGARRAGDTIAELITDIGATTTLHELGVEEDAIPELAEEAMTHIDRVPNPRKHTAADCEAIYRSAL